MSDISKRFEQIVTTTHKKFIDEGRLYPVKTDKGILVGDVLISSDGPYKTVSRFDQVLFDNICLNSAAIKIANYVALGKSNYVCQNIYRADQEYNRLHVDGTYTLAGYHACLQHKDYFKADVLWARYCEIKEQTRLAKKKAERLSSF